MGGPYKAPLSPDDINNLFNDNVEEINKMYVAAGSMIKQLIMELSRGGRNTYISLYNAAPNGHIVYYNFIQGDQTLVSRVGTALGLKQVTNNMLEVYGG